MLNDVTALRNDPSIADVARRRRLPLILMHMRGNPRTMQGKPFARDILSEVMVALRKGAAVARRAGVKNSQLIVDPGIGFGKSDAQNYELIARLPELAKLGFPILVGTSRKGFIGRTLGQTPGYNRGRAASGAPSGVVPSGERLMGTAATTVASIVAGAHIVRVHDVKEIAQAARVADSVLNPALAAAPIRFPPTPK